MRGFDHVHDGKSRSGRWSVWPDSGRRGAAAMLLAAGLLAIVPPAGAASPIAQVNYQGVLRNSSGLPLDGAFDMVFRFFSAPAGGDEILVDDWSQGVGGPVQVTKGLFSVALGAGFPTDGTGPGTYTTLAQVFRDYSAVYLEVQVGGQVLTPRTLMLSAPTALNADHLDGRNAADFLDTSATQQMKAGKLFCADGVYATSSSAGYGIESYGSTAGGFFKDTNSTGSGWIGYGDRGVHASGSEMGGYFKDSDQSGYSEIGSGDYGIKAFGNTIAGYFEDLDGSGWARIAYGDLGVYASGNETGVAGYAVSATGVGVVGQGGGHGGWFSDRFATGQAFVGKDNRGIEAYGSEMGGWFHDTDNTSTSYNAISGYGIQGFGTTAGGYFTDSDPLDSGYAYVGYGDYGVRGFGETAGGYFEDSNGTGYGYVGVGDSGVTGYGSVQGGYFSQTVESGTAMVAWSDRGIQAYGNNAGAYFGDLDSSAFGLVGYGTYKIYGSGAMSFVQNHPAQKDRVIVYTAPEGDETATYTRGTARLVNGEAKVALGETFAWVTNPEIGLTAYVTPRGRPVPLAVASLSTGELVVRGPVGEDVDFDFMVYGLRIGFEETTVVQEKTQEARVPSMADHRRRFEQHPELREFTAQARFGRMEEAAGRSHGRPAAAPGAGAAATLLAAIEEYDPQIHGRPQADRAPAESAGPPPADAAGRVEPVDPQPETARDLSAGTRDGGTMAPAPRRPALSVAERLTDPATQVSDRPAWVQEATAGPASIAESVEAGDVLVAEAEAPGLLKRGASAADRSVVGIVAGEPGRTYDARIGAVDGHGEAPIVVSGFALCKVDASYGAIRVGDLLTTSPTSGRAMRSENPAAGTILGKALEPLASGTGTIRVVVTLR